MTIVEEVLIKILIVVGRTWTLTSTVIVNRNIYIRGFPILEVLI